jgi:uncharacterized damage-inducible protein DinB
MPIPTPTQIDAFESAPSRIVAAIEGLSDNDLLFQPNSDSWSIHEVIQHLADSETFGYERIRRIIAEEKPTLQAFPEAIWAEQLWYRTQNIHLALDLFRVQRFATAALLRILPDTTWARTGTHTERGEMSAYDIFVTFLSHAEAHLEQIEQIKQAH